MYVKVSMTISVYVWQSVVVDPRESVTVVVAIRVLVIGCVKV